MESVKAVAALLVLLLTSAIAAPVTCVGWQGSAESRRECCRRAHHAACHDQAAADSCCAAHEQGRVGTVTSPPAVAHVQAAAITTPPFDASTLEPPTTAIYRAIVIDRLHAPPDLLVLSLRI
jgi:hypothetical protein